MPEHSVMKQLPAGLGLTQLLATMVVERSHRCSRQALIFHLLELLPVFYSRLCAVGEAGLRMGQHSGPDLRDFPSDSQLMSAQHVAAAPIAVADCDLCEAE